MPALSFSPFCLECHIVQSCPESCSRCRVQPPHKPQARVSPMILDGNLQNCRPKESFSTCQVIVLLQCQVADDTIKPSLEIRGFGERSSVKRLLCKQGDPSLTPDLGEKLGVVVQTGDPGAGKGGDKTALGLGGELA